MEFISMRACHSKHQQNIVHNDAFNLRRPYMLWIRILHFLYMTLFVTLFPYLNEQLASFCVRFIVCVLFVETF